MHNPHYALCVVEPRIAHARSQAATLLNLPAKSVSNPTFRAPAIAFTAWSQQKHSLWDLHSLPGDAIAGACIWTPPGLFDSENAHSTTNEKAQAVQWWCARLHHSLQVSGVYCTAAAPCLAPCAIEEGGAGCAPVCISANRRPRCRICKETSMNQTDLPIYCDSVLWPHLACSREVTAVAPKVLRSASCKFQHRGSSFTIM